MTNSIDPQPPRDPEDMAQPSTREIPVVPPSAPLPPHPGATPQAPVAPTVSAPVPDPLAAPQATGPVDFIPGLMSNPPLPPAPQAPPPGGATAVSAAPTWPDTLEPDHPADDRAKKLRTPVDRAGLAGLGLAVLCLVLLEVGLALDFGTRSLWSAVPLWSAFATIAALLGLLAAAASAPGSRVRPGLAWRVAAGGLAGLAVFWLLVVLPNADSNRGFVLTAALAALGAALWIGAGRKA